MDVSKWCLACGACRRFRSHAVQEGFGSSWGFLGFWGVVQIADSLRSLLSLAIPVQASGGMGRKRKYSNPEERVCMYGVCTSSYKLVLGFR